MCHKLSPNKLLYYKEVITSTPEQLIKLSYSFKKYACGHKNAMQKILSLYNISILLMII